ncbi:tetratricopeptide repeat protein 34 [Rhineura floridana]|uniref:tetratricopeptide repeat protein 34 n=1 Tax=Rhineura floridana TaxID=261503 RepID=UPI002AC85DDA|nr:tetratricopeptide repeat protein 34 [Rhineura floridana]
MSSKEQALWLCKEGEQRLAVEDLSIATAFYTAAFSCSIPTAVGKVASLGKESRAKVITTLTRWCRDGSPIPRVQGLKDTSLSVGIAAIFLSTLDPNNMAASLCKMEALLKLGHYEEVMSQCDSLLDEHRCVELVLTKALAQVLLQTRFQKGITDYLCVFAEHRDEAVKFIRNRQKEHLQHIIEAFFDFLSLQESTCCSEGPENWQRNCHDFLAAVAPEDIRVCQAQAAYLFEKHKYKESVSVYSKALEALSDAGAFWNDRASGLLIDRAAAYFSLGGRVQEMMQDLTAAFEACPALAMRRFKALFSAGDSERVGKHARAALDGEFAAYREAVRARPEVRSDGGKELLPPVIRTLRFLIQISPVARRELNVRLADCSLLEGNIQSASEICNRLLGSEEETYYNTLLAIRGFCHLHAKRCEEALQDFQKIIEYSSPHPSSCVKALCGRGLIRAWGGSPYLTALDYITACRFRFEETSFVIKSYVPWNQRGFLLIILQEEARKILERNKAPSSSSASRRTKSRELNSFQMKEGDASGVHQLSSLLLDLDASDETSQLLCADALYQMDRVDEAHKVLLVALSKPSQRSAILARLALLQLKKGFLYDCNQLLKKMTQAGETSCLLTVMKILKAEDRALMQSHCHSRAMTILKHKQGDSSIKEAILYLSFAIIAAGGHAVDSLLTRARCYGHLGQKKTAIFDFNAILKEDPTNAQALSGKGFVHLALNQKKEAVQDLTSALKADPVLAVPEILSLKQEAQVLIHQWLVDHCKARLSEFFASKKPPMGSPLKELAIVGELLVKLKSKEAESHILYVDLLAVDGRHKEALTHLQGAFGHTAPNDSINSRFGMLQAKKGNMNAAAHLLASLAAKDYADLGYLMSFLDTKQRQSLAQVASTEANALVKEQYYAKALGYYSLAILASNGNPRYLRQRAVCLAHLKDYRKALKDIEKVIHNHGTNGLKTQIEDYCLQGEMLLSISEEEMAVKQYIRALQLGQSLALMTIPADRNRDTLSKAFLQMAQSSFAASHYEEAWKTVEYGLMVDPNNTELKKLKIRIKREASGCRVQ